MMVSTNGQRGMDCIELVEVVTDYLERELNEDEVARLESHLGECSGCQAYVDQMRATIEGLRGLAERNGSAVDMEALLSAFRDRR